MPLLRRKREQKSVKLFWELCFFSVRMFMFVQYVKKCLKKDCITMFLIGGKMWYFTNKGKVSGCVYWWDSSVFSGPLGNYTLKHLPVLWLSTQSWHFFSFWLGKWTVMFTMEYLLTTLNAWLQKKTSRYL